MMLAFLRIVCYSRVTLSETYRPGKISQRDEFIAWAAYYRRKSPLRKAIPFPGRLKAASMVRPPVFPRRPLMTFVELCNSVVAMDGSDKDNLKVLMATGDGDNYRPIRNIRITTGESGYIIILEG